MCQPRTEGLKRGSTTNAVDAKVDGLDEVRGSLLDNLDEEGSEEGRDLEALGRLVDRVERRGECAVRGWLARVPLHGARLAGRGLAREYFGTVQYTDFSTSPDKGVRSMELTACA